MSVKDYKVSICDACFAGEGDSCNEPACAFCRVAMVDTLREALRCARELFTEVRSRSPKGNK